MSYKNIKELEKEANGWSGEFKFCYLLGHLIFVAPISFVLIRVEDWQVLESIIIASIFMGLLFITNTFIKVLFIHNYARDWINNINPLMKNSVYKERSGDELTIDFVLYCILTVPLFFTFSFLGITSEFIFSILSVYLMSLIDLFGNIRQAIYLFKVNKAA